jgi:hypothetical protein
MPRYHHFEAADELPHPPGDDPWWQESVFIHWFDGAAGVGGVHRIGHEPNQGGGQANVECGVISESGTRFRRMAPDLPLEEHEGASGFAAGDGHLFSFEGPPHLRVREEGCQLDLDVHDFYPRTDFYPRDIGTLGSDFAPHHFETSGRVTGTVVLDGRTYDIDGLCHRDHSWGIRRWDTLLNHRWVSGSVGPQLCFGSTVWHGSDGSLATVGYVVRDGEITYADDVDVVVFLEPDGISHRGGTVTWYLAGGEELRVDCELVDGVLNQHHGVAWIDGICRVRHDGRQGSCDLEISTNPRNGSGPVTLALKAVADDGLTTRK